MSLLMAGGLESDDLEGPFQPKPFYDSTVLIYLMPTSTITAQERMLRNTDRRFRGVPIITYLSLLPGMGPH